MITRAKPIIDLWKQDTNEFFPALYVTQHILGNRTWTDARTSSGDTVQQAKTHTSQRPLEWYGRPQAVAACWAFGSEPQVPRRKKSEPLSRMRQTKLSQRRQDGRRVQPKADDGLSTTTTTTTTTTVAQTSSWPRPAKPTKAVGIRLNTLLQSQLHQTSGLRLCSYIPYGLQAVVAEFRTDRLPGSKSAVSLFDGS